MGTFRSRAPMRPEALAWPTTAKTREGGCRAMRPTLFPHARWSPSSWPGCRSRRGQIVPSSRPPVRAERWCTSKSTRSLMCASQFLIHARCSAGKPARRVHGPPDRGEFLPLGVRVQGLSDGGADQHPQVGHRVGVGAGGTENEVPGQAHDREQADGRGDADLSDRPQVGHDLADPQGPGAPGRAGVAAARWSISARRDRTRSSCAAPWWPTSWISEEAMPLPTIRSRGRRMIPTGFGLPPGRRVLARRMAAPAPRARYTTSLMSLPVGTSTSNASWASRSSPESQTPVECSLRWVTTR